MSAEWIFEPAPISGARSGGSAAEYSFKGSIYTLVRETVQNSLDARATPGTPVDVKFRIIELDGEHLESFLEALSWNTLEDNLLAIPEKRGGKAIKQALESMEKEDRLRLLVIEDRGTKGLVGGDSRIDDDEINSFCALVKDELYSDKSSGNSGGSFGLGKSLLWAYSSFNTVLFSTVSVSPPNDKSGIRFIGRTTLPFHETAADGQCGGDGWLGVREDVGEGRKRAISVWGTSALDRARKCHSFRENDDFGLSQVIVGFAEPGDEDVPVEDVQTALLEAATRSFWPAIVRKQLNLSVQIEMDGMLIENHKVEPENHIAYRHLVSLLSDYDAGLLSEAELLENPGDQAVVNVNLEVPEKEIETPHSAFEGQVPVLVKILEESPDTELIKDKIFRFREPAMIVHSERRSNLSIAARPYVAIVPAGGAAGPSDENEKIEHFLRAAEPPAHDEWTHDTRSVKLLYREHGCKAKLNRFEDSIREAIRKLVSKPVEKGGELPKALLKFLRFGDKSGGGHDRFLSVTGPQAWIEDDAWKFRVRCRRLKESDRNWFVKVRLMYSVDGGAGDDVHAISSVECDDAITVSTDKGIALLEFPPDITSVVVHGGTNSSDLPSIGTRSAIQLKVDGGLGDQPDA